MQVYSQVQLNIRYLEKAKGLCGLKSYTQIMFPDYTIAE